MRVSSIVRSLAAASAMLVLSGGVSPAAQASGWLQWRGPFNTGMADGDAPLRWSDTVGVAF